MSGGGRGSAAVSLMRFTARARNGSFSKTAKTTSSTTPEATTDSETDLRDMFGNPELNLSGY
jgi:hypothetical protein